MKIVGACVAAALLAGCALGKSKFQCPTPQGAACKSVTEIYEMTDAYGEEGLTAVSRTIKGEDAPPSNASSSAQASQGIAPPVVVVDPGDPFPVRTPAKIMRVLMAPWEDTSGNLHAGGYVFTEIEARKWLIGQPGERRGSRTLKLQVEPSSAVSGAAASPGKEPAKVPTAKPAERMSGGGSQ